MFVNNHRVQEGKFKDVSKRKKRSTDLVEAGFDFLMATPDPTKITANITKEIFKSIVQETNYTMIDDGLTVDVPGKKMHWHGGTAKIQKTCGRLNFVI